MTTITGITYNTPNKGIVLVSDLTRTETSWNTQGDVAFRQQTKSDAQKIHVSTQRDLAVAMSGAFDQPYVDLLSEILSGGIDVRRRIEKGDFTELRSLNLSRWNGRIPNNDYMSGLLIATRFEGKPQLYTCWPLGLVEQRHWTSVGSGSRYAIEYIQAQNVLIPSQLDRNNAIDIAVASLDEASQDIHTGGLDLVIITPNGIEEHGDTIRRTVKDARTRAINSIK